MWLHNNKNEKMYLALGKIGILSGDKREEDWSTYSVKISTERYAYTLNVEVFEYERHLNSCNDLGVISLEIIDSDGFNIQAGMGDDDLKDMLVAIDYCEQFLLNNNIPFLADYRFSKNNAKRKAKNLKIRKKWNIEEFIKWADEKEQNNATRS